MKKKTSWVKSKVQNYDPKHILPFKILDVMQDPAYFKHFLYRFNLQKEFIANCKRSESQVFAKHKEDPEGLLSYSIDWIRRKIFVCSHSSREIKPEDRPKGPCPPIDSIILPACSDWVTEKTGRDPEFEIPSNRIKGHKDYNFASYGPEKRRKAREAKEAARRESQAHVFPYPSDGGSSISEDPRDEYQDLY